ncbi:MAG TPA: zinc ABC transporter substrate-binding protein [Anaerolineales bacterium]|nr:zinc ABC transporter substrate-binding protein [Anaerolineae bacterium]HIQ00869.1 zinc ABC transporter substrate-binding protein [Anaerolineales bacterium]
MKRMKTVKNTRKLYLFALFAAFAVQTLLATACTPARTPRAEEAALTPVPLAAGERLRVAATTTIVGDVVAQVGRDAVELTVLLRPGVEPHTYQPRPSDLAAVADAHVLFVNGLGLETFLEEMLENVGGDRPVVSVSAGIQPRQHPRQAGQSDPHVWFDVRNVMTWVESIEAALSALDPAHADTYAVNAADYRQELETLDRWIVEQVATVPEENRRLVTNHPAFGYFADRYGFQQVGTVYPVSPSAEPSAQDIAQLEEAILRQGVPAVFAENTVNPVLARQVAQDTGVALVPLYTGSLGEPGSGVESYIALMEYDVRAIVEALGGGR